MEYVDAAADEEMEWIVGMEMEWIAEMQEIVLMKKKGESTMILIMQYLDFNLPNFLLWTVMIFFTVYQFWQSTTSIGATAPHGRG